MKSEKVIRKEIDFGIGGNGQTTLFSNPTGKGFVGSLANPTEFAQSGNAVLVNARHQSFGLGTKPNQKKKDSGGFPDKIGIHTIKITPEMVGKTIGIFCGVEVKRVGKKPSTLQQRRVDLINRLGGMAFPATSVEEAEQGIIDFEEGLKA